MVMLIDNNQFTYYLSKVFFSSSNKTIDSSSSNKTELKG